MEGSASTAQVVFGAASDEQRLYVESLEERVAVYEQDAFERVMNLKDRVRARLRAQDWTDDDVDELFAEDSPS